MTKISETPAMAPAKNWKPKGRAIHNTLLTLCFHTVISTFHISIYAFVRVQTCWREYMMIKTRFREREKEKKV